jgi:signal transduction histidine kinase
MEIFDWRALGTAWRDAQRRVEELLAIGRVFPFAVLLPAVTYDPELPARDRVLAEDALAAYAIVSAVVLFLALRRSERLERLARMTHAADAGIAAALVYLMAPMPSALVMAAFSLVAAAARWGPLATLTTGGLCLAAFVFAVEAKGELLMSPGAPFSFGTSLVALTLLVAALASQARAFFAQRDVFARALAGIGAARSLSDALTRVVGECLDYVKASRAVLAVEHSPTHKAYLWQFDREAGPTVRELQPDLRHHYLPGELSDARTWIVRKHPDGSLIAHGRARTGRNAGLTPLQAESAAWILQRCKASALLASETDLREWRLRLVLIDPVDPFPPDALDFLQNFVEGLGPVMQRDYDVRALRARIAVMERTRLARDLHDGPVQTLLGLEFEIEALRRQAMTTPVQMHQLDRLRQAVQKSTADTRDLLFRLQAPASGGDDVLRSIAELAVRLRREAGIDVRVESSIARIDGSHACRHVPRIVQEALANIRKHSGAQTVAISVTETEQSYRLSVADDGRGFGFAGRMTLEQLERSDLGPKLIKQRVRAMHGSMTIDSTPGEGARVEVEWPRNWHV